MFGCLCLLNFWQSETLTTDNPAEEGNGQPINQTNCGNVVIDAQLQGADLDGQTDPTWIIGVGNVTYYGSDDVGSSVALTDSWVTLQQDIAEQGTSQIWNWIDVPSPIKAQTYQGTYSVQAIEDA